MTVAPNPASIAVGGTVGLTAALSGDAAGQAVTWTTSNAAVATVAGNGASATVTGVAAGQAAITASTANGFSSSATINVGSTSSNQQASVSISSITKGGLTQPVALNDVRGQIDVTLNVDPGQQNVERVELVVTDSATGVATVVASQSIVATGSVATAGLEGLALQVAQANAQAAAMVAANVPQQITLSFNTASFNPDTTGDNAARFLNGRKLISARLVIASGTSQDQVASNAVAVYFNNTDGFYVVQTPKSSTGVVSATSTDVAPGTVWYQTGAGLEVRTVPVMYSGRAVASRTVTYDRVNSATDPTQVVAGAGIKTVTLAIGTISDSGRVEVTSAVGADGNAITLVTYGNEVGVLNAQPRGTPNNNENIGVRLDSLRTDNVAPAASFAITATDSNWVNGPYAFLRAGNVAADDDAVGLSTAAAPFGATFEYAGCGTAAYKAATTGADVGECATDLTNRAYAGRIVVKDRLGNTQTTAPLTFAVDVTAPRFAYLTPTQSDSIVGNAANRDSVFHPVAETYAGVTSNNAVFGLRFTDERSGFNVETGSLLAKITRLAPPAPGATTCALGTATCAPERFIGTVEDATMAGFDPTFRRIEFPIYGDAFDATTPGYYEFSATLTDRAGNSAVIIGGTSTTITKKAAIDVDAPQITGITVPAMLTGGQPATFTPTGTDDLEVIMGDIALNYDDLNDGIGNGYLRWRGEFFPMYDAPWNQSIATPVGPGAAGAAGLTIPGGFITRIETVDNDSTPQQAIIPTLVDTVAARLRDIKTTSSWVDNAVGFAAGTSTLLQAPIFVGNLTVAGVTFGSREGVTTDATRVNQFYVMTANPTNQTVTVRAVGPTISVNPPFTRIEVARLDAVTGAYDVLAGTLSAPATADQGDNRFYTWTFTLNAVGTGSGKQAALANGQTLRVIGVDANGNGLATLPWLVGTGAQTLGGIVVP